jgi:hypothetical protein
VTFFDATDRFAATMQPTVADQMHAREDAIAATMRAGDCSRAEAIAALRQPALALRDCACGRRTWRPTSWPACGVDCAHWPTIHTTET